MRWRKSAFDAARAAAVLMRLQDDKEQGPVKIFCKGKPGAARKPWAVFAIRGLGNALPEAADLTEILAKKWQTMRKITNLPEYPEIPIKAQ